jgi:hypothetical protein
MQQGGSARRRELRYLGSAKQHNRKEGEHFFSDFFLEPHKPSDLRRGSERISYYLVCPSLGFSVAPGLAEERVLSAWTLI